jgi:hypothetical protein
MTSMFYLKARFRNTAIAKKSARKLKRLMRMMVNAASQVGASDNEFEEEYKLAWSEWPELMTFFNLPVRYGSRAYKKLCDVAALEPSSSPVVDRKRDIVFIEAECNDDGTWMPLCEAIRCKLGSVKTDWISEEEVDAWKCLHV